MITKLEPKQQKKPMAQGVWDSNHRGTLRYLAHRDLLHETDKLTVSAATTAEKLFMGYWYLLHIEVLGLQTSKI